MRLAKPHSTISAAWRRLFALAEAFPQFSDELGVPLHGENPGVGFSQMGGECALSGAEFDDEIGLVQ